MHRALLLLIISLSTWSTEALVDMPPTISQIGFSSSNPSDVSAKFTALEKPEDYVVVGVVSDDPDVRSRLLCEASNADRIHWEYRETTNDEWNTTNIPMTDESPATTEGKLITLIISESGSSVTGYYRCVATYLSYIVMSPPVRLIVPRIEDLGNSVFSSTVPGTPTKNQPYEVPCFQAIDTQLVPTDAAEFTGLNVKWTRRVGNIDIPFPDAYDGAKDKGRFSVNPNTGALSYGYVLESDNLGNTEDGETARLQCKANLDNQRELLVGNYASMSVITSAKPLETVNVSYPRYTLKNGKMVAEHTCTSNKLCRIVTTFTGEYSARGKVIGKAPEGVDIVIRNGKDRELKEGGPYSGFEFVAVTETEIRQYVAELTEVTINADGEEEFGEALASLYINVETQNYPTLSDRTGFKEFNLVTTGTDVTLTCDVMHKDSIEFFINGVKVRQESRNYVPPYVTYVGENTMTVADIQRSDSFSVQCVANNEVGTLYANSIVSVYDAPNATQHPLADDPYRLKEGDNVSTPFRFSYSVILDEKTRAASIYWNSTRKDLPDSVQNARITTRDDYGVLSVLSQSYNENGDGLIESVLDLEINRETQYILKDTEWQCVVEYYMLDRDEKYTVASDPVRFEIFTAATQAPVKEPWPHYPVLFGAIGGLVFLILLIVLINCYVQKNKGEQYYVDEKERNAGHNPAEEMEAYGFSDYTRPDQNPIKGSRASMNNMSAGKPMESDTGSLDDYGGDMDASRYNEDGSFIGQYGQSGQPYRNGADV